MYDTASEGGDEGLGTSKLYRLRMKHNYTQQSVAEALSVSPATLSRWEKDPDKMHIDELRKAAEFYGVSAEWLLTPDPVVLHMHDNQVANGAYNTVHMVPQEMWDRFDKRMDETVRLNEELLRLNQRLMDVIEKLSTRTG